MCPRLPLALSAALLAACANTPAAVNPTYAHLAVRPLVTADGDAAVVSNCTQSISSALPRRGFFLDPAGKPVTIEASMFPDTHFRLHPADEGTASTRLSYTADLTATIAPGRTAAGSGHGEESADPSLSPANTARVAACSA